VLEQHSSNSVIARAKRRAIRERARATRAAGIADRHEFLAEQGTPQLRVLHLDMAAMHRDIERRHLAAASLHIAYAERLAVAGAASAPFMAALAGEVGASHVGISLVLGDRTEAVTVASDAIATFVQEAENTLGEGPVHDVTAGGVPVVVDETAFPLRWPRFAPAVARFGVRSVAAEPLRTSTGCLGVLTVFDPPTEPVASLATVADALVYTALLAPDSADPLDLPLLAGANDHTFVHQACGMVAEQLGCDVADGLAILQARAFATGTSLAALADDVVHKGLRMS
jgi:hypothetical protein